MCIYWLSNIDFQFCQPKFGAIPILQEGPFRLVGHLAAAQKDAIAWQCAGTDVM